MKFGKRTALMKILAFVLALVLMVPWSVMAEMAESPAVTAQEAENKEDPVTGKGSGEEGNIFSPAGFLGEYTVSFYQEDPEGEDVPDNNLIAEYVEVAFGEELSALEEKLEEDHPEYEDTQWTIENIEVTNNLTVWAANAENAAQIGSNTYPTLQSAVDAVKNGDVPGGSEIRLLKNVEENIASESVNYTLDMQGHKISAPAGSTERVYTVKGGTVTLKNGTITGGNTSDDGAGLAVLANASVTAENLTVTKNNCHGGLGGGIYLESSNAVMNNCTVSENDVDNKGDGGGICLYEDANLEATGLIVEGNTADTNGIGGGIYVKGVSNYTPSASKLMLYGGCAVRNNHCANNGAGIAFLGAVFEAEGLDVINNISTGSWSNGGGIYIYGTKKGTAVSLKNVNISGNSIGSQGGGIYVRAGKFRAENCTISGNTTKQGSAIYSMDYILSDTAYLKGCTIQNNNATQGSTIDLGDNSVSYEDCRIENNTATDVGAIEVPGETAILVNTVITGNTGGMTGGVWGNMQMTGGALYGNTATDGEGANDWKIGSASSYSFENPQIAAGTSVPKASEMTDGTMDFSNYIWKDSLHKIKIDGTLDETTLAQEEIARIPDADYPQGSETFCFTAGLPVRYVAEIVDSSETYPGYETLADAIWYSGVNWNEANTAAIKLIAGESDNSGKVITENIYIGDRMIVSIDMNGRTLKSSSGKAVRIDEGGELVLYGTEGGTVETRSTGVTIENKGSLTINSPVSVRDIDHQGQSLILSDGAKIDSIRLAEDRFVTAGEGFAPEKLTFEIAASKLAALNNWENAGAQDEVVVTLIVPAEGCTFSDDLAKKITVKNANGYVTVEKDQTTGNIVARTMNLNGVYIDGVNGDDENPGTHDQPVKTFEAALTVLEDLVQTAKEAGKEMPEGIYVVNTVTVNQSAAWSLKGELAGMRLMREPSFTGTMIQVSKAGTKLELSDIIIDGLGDKVTANGILINVTSESELEIKNGAVLKNNNRSAGYGGAVLAENAKVVINGGEIRENHSKYAGGIGLFSATLTMNSGIIADNSADMDGGAAGVFKDSKMYLNGGTISGNTSRQGGGISVGGSEVTTVGNGSGELVMNGGTISGNTSRECGGGIYVQCKNTARVSAGDIVRNTSKSGQFGGGGIYVNGTRNVDGADYDQGRLIVTNAVIRGNSAGQWGGGIAGCSTSTVNVYRKNGAYVYGNTAVDGSNQIFVSHNQATLGTPDYDISGYMPDGTPYNWTDRNGEPVSADKLKNNRSFTTIVLNNAVTPNVQGASVNITGNSAAIGGGGIGTNGFVQIGEPDNDREIPVTKTWDDGGHGEGNRPDYVDIWLLRNKERVAFLRFKKNSDGTWPASMSFTGQPATDASGAAYEYTVEEEMPKRADGTDYPYIGIVTGDAGNGFKVTNTYTAKGTWIPKGTKVLDGRDMAAGEFKFTVKEGNKVVSSGTNAAAKAGEIADIRFSAVTYSKEDAGEHTYVIDEVHTGLPAGVTADPRSYQVTVKVKDNGDGTMTADAVYSRGTDIFQAAAFVNTYKKEEIYVSFDKVDAQTGEPVIGATLRLVDMEGNQIDEWITNGRSYTIRGILKEGVSYRLLEVSAPEGYEIAEDIVFTVNAENPEISIVMEDKKKEDTPEHVSVKVTKHLSLNGDPIGAVDQTFYVALYEDKECTKRVTDIKPIVFHHASASTVVFEQLEAGKTYYVGECDVNGEVIYTGTVGDDAVFMATFAHGNEAKAEKNGDTAVVEFENEMYTIPVGFYKECKLTVTKKLLGANGKAKNSQDTFYIGVFEDRECTRLTDKAAENIIALPLEGGSEASKTVTVEYIPGQEITLYIAEVDENGNLVESQDDFSYSVTYDADSVTYNDEQLKNKVTITNKEQKDKTETESEKTTEKSSTKKAAAKTGDNTPIAFYLLLLGIAAVAILAGSRRYRKNK